MRLRLKRTFLVPATLVLLACYPFAASVAGQEPGSVSMEQWTDRGGLDYKNFELNGGPEQCQVACMQDDKCEAYTWVRRGAATALCYLKTGVPLPTRDVECVSGVKRSFPQGLSGGLTYSGDRVDGGSVDGTETILHSETTSRGFRSPKTRVVSDGDRGRPAGSGFYHQELLQGGTGGGDVGMGGSRSRTPDAYFLPAGTACGFHHTQNSPANPATGIGTCLGMDPGRGVCPAGWVARRHFDMGSGNGSRDCGQAEALLHPEACGYFVWCEYTDPRGLCEDAPCIRTAVSKTTLGILSNTDASGATLRPMCPPGTIRTPFYDDGRPSGRGLSFCRN